jgi:cytidyltransferase-like protein
MALRTARCDQQTSSRLSQTHYCKRIYILPQQLQARLNYHHSERGSAESFAIRRACGAKSIAFVSGNFNVVHPGHLRLLKFAAEQADALVVGVNSDLTAGVTIAQDMRLENVRSIGIVDYAVGLDLSVEAFITALKPDVVVKGKEFGTRFNPEQAPVEAYGVRLIFSPGELRLLRCRCWNGITRARIYFRNKEATRFSGPARFRNFSAQIHAHKDVGGCASW